MIPAMSAIGQPEIAYDGKLFKVQVLHRTDAGGVSRRREVVRHPGAVLIIPLLAGDRVVMIRNYRVAPGQTLWECPAGKLEPAEDPLAAAHRELEEETGHRAGRVTKLGEFYTSPGFTDELMHAFLAQDLEFVGQKLEPGEEIEVEPVDLDEAFAMAADGRLRDGKTIAGLFLCRMRLERDRK